MREQFFILFFLFLKYVRLVSLLGDFTVVITTRSFYGYFSAQLEFLLLLKTPPIAFSKSLSLFDRLHSDTDVLIGHLFSYVRYFQSDSLIGGIFSGQIFS